MSGNENTENYPGANYDHPMPNNISSISRVVLLGAGASMPAGLPSTAELNEEIGARAGTTYRHWRSLLGQYSDFESVASVLQAIESDGPLQQLVRKVPLSNHQLTPRPNTSEAATETLGVIREVLVGSLWLDENIGSDRSSKNPCAYLRPIISAQQGSTIFTLNYDNTLAVSGRNVRLPTGTPKSEVGVARSVRYGPPRVLTLHGYLNWHHEYERIGREIDNVVFPELHEGIGSPEHRPAIVFGSGNKMRHFGPFLRMLGEFQNELASVGEVVTIGYGWRDPHINHMILQWARRLADRQPRALLVVVNRDGTKPPFVEKMARDYPLKVVGLGDGVDGWANSEYSPG